MALYSIRELWANLVEMDIIEDMALYSIRKLRANLVETDIFEDMALYWETKNMVTKYMQPHTPSSVNLLFFVIYYCYFLSKFNKIKFTKR